MIIITNKNYLVLINADELKAKICLLCALSKYVRGNSWNQEKKLS